MAWRMRGAKVAVSIRSCEYFVLDFSAKRLLAMPAARGRHPKPAYLGGARSYYRPERWARERLIHTRRAGAGHTHPASRLGASPLPSAHRLDLGHAECLPDRAKDRHPQGVRRCGAEEKGVFERTKLADRASAHPTYRCRRRLKSRKGNGTIACRGNIPGRAPQPGGRIVGKVRMVKA